MSRSGYSDDLDDNWQLIMYRGAVNSAIKGARGQKLLRELLAALDAMPEKRLISGALVDADGEFCALGALGAARKICDLGKLDPDEPEAVAAVFDIAPALAREIVYENDEYRSMESPEQRWKRMRNWAQSHINRGI